MNPRALLEQALAPDDLAAEVRQAIERALDLDALHALRQQEAQERKQATRTRADLTRNDP